MNYVFPPALLPLVLGLVFPWGGSRCRTLVRDQLQGALRSEIRLSEHRCRRLGHDLDFG